MTSDRLRIAIDGRPALWPRTGIGTIAANVLNTISDFDKANRYFAYFNSDPAKGFVHPPSIETRWGGPHHKLAWANTWLPRQLALDSIDIFITFLDKELPLLPTETRIVSMVHDLIPLKFPGVVFRNPAHRAYYNILIRASIRRSDVVLTNSDFSRREIVAQFGADESKVRKITLGVDPMPLADRTQVARVLRRYQLQQPFLIALGSTEPRKNNAGVIEAVRRLKPEHPDLQLAIVGSNWRGRAFDAGVLHDFVRLLGHVPNEDLPVLMQSAEMLVFPSLHEGFGFPVIEAMSLGIPVVTSNLTALPEVAGDAALLINPHDADAIAAAIKTILEDQNLAADLTRRGRARASYFQWKTTCEELVAVCAGVRNSSLWQKEPVTP